MVVAGAAGDSKGEHEFRDVIAGKVISGFRFGELAAGRTTPAKIGQTSRFPIDRIGGSLRAVNRRRMSTPSMVP